MALITLKAPSVATPARLKIVHFPPLTMLPSLMHSALTDHLKSLLLAATAPIADSQKRIMSASRDRTAQVL